MLYTELMNKLSGPDYVAIDLRSPLLKFYKDISSVTFLPQQALSAILYLLVDGIKREESADYDVEAIAFGIYEEQIGIEALNEHDVDCVALATRELANGLVNHIRTLYLYDGGRLNYRFYCWLDPFTPVLEKYIETDAFAGEQSCLG